MNFKRTILIDLDGVLNNYTGGYHEEYIPEIKEGAQEFIKNLYDEGFELKLFTTRPVNLTSRWLENYKMQNYFSEITSIKKPAWLIIDDRCLTFTGNYAECKSKIDSFQPWYKKIS